NDRDKEVPEMPYVIRPPRLRTAVAACAAALLVGAVPAQAGNSKEITSPSKCVEPTLYQPFTSFGDSNYYALPAGEEYNNFTGKGWVLSGGAQFVQTRLYDGTTGYVLDMPAKSRATSPNRCLNPEYPTARAILAYVFGQSNRSSYVPHESSGKTPSSAIPPRTWHGGRLSRRVQ